MAPASLDVVIPAYNEADQVAVCAAAFIDALGGLSPEVTVRLLFVDDGSSDATWPCIRHLVESSDGRVSGLRLLRNFGKESAIAAGLHASSADLVGVADCDLEHPPEALRQMVDIAIARWPDVDVVEAVREKPLARGPLGTLGARLFYGALRRFSGMELEGHTDFKVLSRRIVDAYRSTPERSKFFKGFVAWLRAPSVKVPFVPLRTREVGRWSLIGLARYAGRNLIGYSSIAFAAGIAVSILGVLLGLAATVKAFYDVFAGTAAAGFSSVIALLFLLHAAGFTLLALVLAVLGRVLDEVQARPRFLVDTRIDLDPSNGVVQCNRPLTSPS